MISNNSRVEVWERCRREYYYSYVWEGTGLRPIRTAAPLVDGSAIHEGLAALYKGHTLEESQQDLKSFYATQLDGWTLTREGRIRTSDSEDWGCDLLEAYANRDENTADRYSLTDDFMVSEVETQFQVVLGEICWSCGTPYPVGEEMFTHCESCQAIAHWWVGRADLVVIKDGKHKIIDHKTTSSAGSAWLNSFAYSMQQIGYCYGIGKHNGTSITGYGINALKKLQKVLPYHVQCTKCKGKGTVRKSEDLCTNCQGHGTIQKQPNQLFIRRWYPCGQDRKDRFIHNRIIQLNEIEEEKQKWDAGEDIDELYPMCGKSCFTMRSKEGCPFIPLCWNNPQQATKWYDINDARLAAYYEVREDDYVELIRELIREEVK